eukprot:Skav223359  [mRNA]  locus=scaffold200:519128:523637:+ [translate_table: standard]
MFADSGSANVDLFFHSVPQGPCESVTHLEERLAKAWEENPEVCLKQIFLIGSSREGKQDRYSFYSALVWLWHKDPATLLANLHHIPECNYWKALLELLARLCEGPRRSLERDKALFGHYLRGQNLPEGLPGPAVAKGGRKILMKDAKVAEDCPGHVSWCPGSRLELAEAALKRYDADPLYRSLFERVGQLFAEQLSADLLHMKKGSWDLVGNSGPDWSTPQNRCFRGCERISLCAKWCPLLQHSFDRRTLICESIARWLFPAARWKPQLTERHYAFRARDQLRKALGQLKEYMKCTERLMCQNRWAEIQYRKVHATCLAQNAKLFEKNDPLRFQRFIDQLTKRKGKANVGALQPHQLLKTILTSSTAFERVLAQAQWRALVERLRSAGNLSNSIAVCDWAAPTGPSADQSHQQLSQRLDWGFSTNFHKVFDLLKSDPPRQVFVFSDMHFADAGGSEPVLRKVRKDYQKLNLELPELVFWNLAARDSGAPALANDTGVVLMSGFSPQLIRSLMDGNCQEESIQQPAKTKEKARDPLTAMCAALQKPLFQKLRVVYSHEEAIHLYQSPTAPGNFQKEPMELLQARTYQKPPLQMAKLELGNLKEAWNLYSLRCQMRHQVAEFLHKFGKVKFKFRLDVAWFQRKGYMTGTLRARLPLQDLQQALQIIQTLQSGRKQSRRSKVSPSPTRKKCKRTVLQGMKRRL